jgi:hypothetical protein
MCRLFGSVRVFGLNQSRLMTGVAEPPRHAAVAKASPPEEIGWPDGETLPPIAGGGGTQLTAAGPLLYLPCV